MSKYKKSGVVRPACEIVNINDFEGKDTKLQRKQQEPYCALVAEQSYFQSKHEYAANPTPENLWAMGILEQAYFKMFGGV